MIPMYGAYVWCLPVLPSYGFLSMVPMNGHYLNAYLLRMMPVCNA